MDGFLGAGADKIKQVFEVINAGELVFALSVGVQVFKEQLLDLVGEAMLVTSNFGGYLLMDLTAMSLTGSGFSFSM
jgi:hypothetical protein